MEFLYFLENLRCGFLDAVMSFITEFGGELVFMVIAMTVVWCFDKHEGLFLLCTGLVGTVLNQFLKITFRISRPWVKDPSFTIVESAREAATGYSFPSGHTQNSVGTFGGIAYWTSKKWLRAVCIALVILVPFSRMYLGVHTPLDVGVAFLMAALLIAVLGPIFKKHANNPKFMWITIAAMSVIALANLFYVELYSFPADVQAENYASALKNAYSMVGALLGFALGYFIESRYVKFETNAHIAAQIAKVVLGLGVSLAVKEGLKPVMKLIFGSHQAGTMVRYFLLVVVAYAVWPLMFKPLDRLAHKIFKK